MRSMNQQEYQGEAYQGAFHPRELEKFNLACQMVAKAPYRWLGTEVRCHELARAVAELLKLTFEDGYYGMVEHSWIWLSPREPLSPLPKILDVYVPGRIPQVQLIDPHIHLPFEYRRGSPRTDINQPILVELIRLMRSTENSMDRCI